MALILALICVVGVLPISARADSPDSITLDNCTYPGISYQSDALGKCVLQEIRVNYGSSTIVSFCGDHGMGMGYSLNGQNGIKRVLLLTP